MFYNELKIIFYLCILLHNPYTLSSVFARRTLLTMGRPTIINARLLPWLWLFLKNYIVLPVFFFFWIQRGFKFWDCSFMFLKTWFGCFLWNTFSSAHFDGFPCFSIPNPRYGPTISARRFRDCTGSANPACVHTVHDTRAEEWCTDRNGIIMTRLRPKPSSTVSVKDAPRTRRPCSPSRENTRVRRQRFRRGRVH